jgi:hypothetical protein
MTYMTWATSRSAVKQPVAMPAISHRWVAALARVVRTVAGSPARMSAEWLHEFEVAAAKRQWE